MRNDLNVRFSFEVGKITHFVLFSGICVEIGMGVAFIIAGIQPEVHMKNLVSSLLNL